MWQPESRTAHASLACSCALSLLLDPCLALACFKTLAVFSSCFTSCDGGIIPLFFYRNAIFLH